MWRSALLDSRMGSGATDRKTDRSYNTSTPLQLKAGSWKQEAVLETNKYCLKKKRPDKLTSYISSVLLAKHGQIFKSGESSK